MMDWDGSWDGSWGVGGWLVMGLMMVAMWGIPIALLVWLIVRGFGSGQSQPRESRRPDAEETLAERFASGEIDEDEFTRRRELLRAQPRGQ